MLLLITTVIYRPDPWSTTSLQWIWLLDLISLLQKVEQLCLTIIWRLLFDTVSDQEGLDCTVTFDADVSGELRMLRWCSLMLLHSTIRWVL